MSEREPLRPDDIAVHDIGWVDDERAFHAGVIMPVPGFGRGAALIHTQRAAEAHAAELRLALGVLARARAVAEYAKRGQAGASTGSAYDLYFVVQQAAALLLEADEAKRATMPGANMLGEQEKELGR